MKIGIFTETYKPTINGVVISIGTFKYELEKRGHEYFIFAPFNKHDKSSEKNVFRFPALHFPNDPIYPLALPMPFSLAKNQFPLEVIKSLDVIHVQHFAMMGQYGLRFAKAFDIPAVYTYHTMAELYTGYIPLIGDIFDPAIRSLTRYTARQADCIVVPTKSVKKYLDSIGVKNRIDIVPTGVHTSAYHRTHPDYVRAKYHIPDGQKILLYVGRMAMEKNIQFLLDAFMLVRNTYPDVHLLLIGGGPDKDKVKTWVTRQKLDKYITCTGFLEREETIKLFGTGDLFVFPSVTDTQGIVIIEAMASGTVPVAIDRLGPGDIINSGINGYLTGLNKEAFAAKIIDLLSDNQKRKQFATVARNAAKAYDAAKTALALEAIYERIKAHPRTSTHS